MKCSQIMPSRYIDMLSLTRRRLPFHPQRRSDA